MSNIKTLGVVANDGKPHAADMLCRLAAAAQRLGIRLLADEPAASLLGLETATPAGQIGRQADAIAALGGDGTVLRAVRELSGAQTPILGVNIGGLGFLTSVAEKDLERALESLASGAFRLGTRTMVACTIEGPEGERGRYRGLNEVLISRGATTRVIRLEVSVDNDRGTSYVCDGLIVATPTGSTGHSLSAGGPIVTPGTGAFVISVICAHTLSSRPLVVPDTGEILVTAAESAGEMRVEVDGQCGEPLRQGERVRIRKTAHGARFVQLPDYSYFSVLRQKLSWSGSNV